MEFMFYKCVNLTSLDLSSFQTENVISMKSMFNSCSSLKQLDLSNFNTKNCYSFGSMFTGVKECNITILNKENNELFLENFKDRLIIISE